MDRHIIKAILYRTIAILSEFSTLYLLSGSFEISVKYTVVLGIVSSIIYYVYEKVWDKYIKKKVNGEKNEK